LYASANQFRNIILLVEGIIVFRAITFCAEYNPSVVKTLGTSSEQIPIAAFQA